MQFDPALYTKTPADRSRELIAAAAAEFGVGYRDVLSPDRHDHVVAARHAAIKALKEAKPHLSTPQIGRLFSRDHTTVLWALGRTKKGKEQRARRCGAGVAAE